MGSAQVNSLALASACNQSINNNILYNFGFGYADALQSRLRLQGLYSFHVVIAITSCIYSMQDAAHGLAY